MLTIGLVGGVASGKTKVAQYLQDRGALVLQADQVGHQVLLEEFIKEKLRTRWGEKVFADDGEVDRKQVAKIVFGPAAAAAADLRFLESVVHPEIQRRLERQLDEARLQGTKVTILDAPVMFKAGWERLCDEVLFVEADISARQARAAVRGWTPEVLGQREAAQTPLEEKRARATCMVDNSGDWAATAEQLDRLWNEWFSRR